MAIRITGMYSGLDTESIINELASAQSYKKNQLVKAQTKLSWKQDAWKSLNTKIYSFYQKLDDLRLQSSYMKKKTVVSNANAIQVTGGKVDGSHKVSVKQLSQRASVTSGNLSNGNTYYTGNATLKQLGFSGSGSIRLSDAAGNYVDIDVNENMKINDFVKTIGDKTALTASFDEDNQRIYLSSWASGEAADFFLSGNDAGGMEALKTLKLLSTNDIDKLTAAGGEYDVWSKYVNVDITGDQPAYSSANYTDEYKKLIEAEALNRLKALKAENDKLTQANENCDKANQKNLDTFAEIFANDDGQYDDYLAHMTGYDPSWSLDNADDLAEIKAAGEALYKEIYGEQDKDTDGNPAVDADGNPVMKSNGMVQELESLQDDLKAAQEALQQAKEDLENGTAIQDDVDRAEAAVTKASEDVSAKQSEIDKAKEIYSVYSAFDKNMEEKAANQAKINANDAQFQYTKDADGKEIYQEKDANGDVVAIGQGVVSQAVAAEFDQKVVVAQNMMNNTQDWKDAALGTKVDGANAKIEVDGVTYESGTDTVTVNGLTITAMEETDKPVTVTTKDDTDGIYDMIKGFVKAFSELMIEMDTLYNAESSSGYEPLLSEEKDALSDSEIEEWEKKIKDSLLRRDSTLSDISSAMRMDMMLTMKVGNVTISLAAFGIETLGYFAAADNEKNAYHIAGDPDDDKTKNNTDKLRAMIESDPDTVMNFFTQLTNNLHDTLAEKMSATTLSSALTVYNDKKMKEEYDEYTQKIKDQEERLNSYIDKWYAKFSAMETALAKLESKNSSLTSLFGG